MSGIFGVFHRDGRKASFDDLTLMSKSLVRRGPDAKGYWCEDSVGLGHRMLRTTPESWNENQPLVDKEARLTITADARIDNRNELISHIGLNLQRAKHFTDSRLILEAYIKWQNHCVDYLLGDFAFVIWDTQRNHLFCARDHVGARPFYYTSNKKFFAFASEDEALLQLPGVSSQPNEELIANFLVPAFDSFDKKRSWIWDISILLPGKIMVISADGRMQTTIYWQIEPGEESVYASEMGCQEAFLDVFSEAVRCRMRTTGNIAAMMSGGLDSASIAATTKRLLAENPDKELHTYSAISDHQETCIESQCIQSLTKELGANAHYVTVPSFHNIISTEDLINAAWTNAHPVNNSILMPAMMCLAASRDNHRVMLHGVSGDMTMYASPRYVASYLCDGHWHRAWEECKGASLNHTFLYGTSPYMLLLMNIWTAYMPIKLKSLRNRLRMKRLYLSQKLINPDFAQKFRLIERLELQETEKSQYFTKGTQDSHAQALGNLGDVLGVTGYERIAGQYSVESRDPWADKRVLEFFLHLPLHYKVRQGWTKYLARTAFAQDLDSIVLQRRDKEHLGWHFAAHLMNETSEFVSSNIEQNIDNLGDYINVNTVLARYKHYKINGGNTHDHNFIYEISTLLLWFSRISK